ncbi:MAG: hypothetical protein MJ218_02395 [Opitutales bacterium]|nr:hypothetical protein [Opitutales bacterium]
MDELFAYLLSLIVCTYQPASVGHERVRLIERPSLVLQKQAQSVQLPVIAKNDWVYSGLSVFSQKELRVPFNVSWYATIDWEGLIYDGAMRFFERYAQLPRKPIVTVYSRNLQDGVKQLLKFADLVLPGTELVAPFVLTGFLGSEPYVGLDSETACCVHLFPSMTWGLEPVFVFKAQPESQVIRTLALTPIAGYTLRAQGSKQNDDYQLYVYGSDAWVKDLPDGLTDLKRYGGCANGVHCEVVMDAVRQLAPFPMLQALFDTFIQDGLRCTCRFEQDGEYITLESSFSAEPHTPLGRYFQHDSNRVASHRSLSKFMDCTIYESNHLNFDGLRQYLDNCYSRLERIAKASNDRVVKHCHAKAQMLYPIVQGILRTCNEVFTGNDQRFVLSDDRMVEVLETQFMPSLASTKVIQSVDQFIEHTWNPYMARVGGIAPNASVQPFLCIKQQVLTYRTYPIYGLSDRSERSNQPFAFFSVYKQYVIVAKKLQDLKNGLDYLSDHPNLSTRSYAPAVSVADYFDKSFSSVSNNPIQIKQFYKNPTEYVIQVRLSVALWNFIWGNWLGANDEMQSLKKLMEVK